MSHEAGRPVNLFGSRVTLIANIAALAVAFVISIEVAYIENKHFGHVLPSDTFLCFFPALVMFAIRSEPFSCFFLLVYFLISIRLLFVAHGIFEGTYSLTRSNNPLFMLVLFALATIICLAIYVIGVLVKLGFSHTSSEK